MFFVDKSQPRLSLFIMSTHLNRPMNIPSANVTVRTIQRGYCDRACTCYRKGTSPALWLCRSTLALYCIARQLDDLAFYENNNGRSGLSVEWILRTWMAQEGRCTRCRRTMEIPVECATHTIDHDACVTVTRENPAAPHSRLNTRLACLLCHRGGEPITAVFTPFDN